MQYWIEIYRIDEYRYGVRFYIKCAITLSLSV